MRAVAPLLVLSALLAFVPSAGAADQDFNGRWDLTVHGMVNCHVTCGWWLEVTGAGTSGIKGSFIGLGDGTLRQLADTAIKDGVLRFTLGPEVGNGGRRPAPAGAAAKGPERAGSRGGGPGGPPPRTEYQVRYADGKLEGSMSGARNAYTFTGVRMPAIDEHDDGSWVKGEPIILFNGKDLSGWHGMVNETPAGWVVEDGVLATAGRGDNLLTNQKFWNFDLHVEWSVGERGNSGIGLRGRYEVQIGSDYGREPTMHSTGALYTRLLPPVNASKPPGEWNTFDIRLIGLDVTTVFNGVKLYEKAHIDGLTAIAYEANEGEPNSLELQGDHAGVKYRNLILTPLIKKAK